MIYKSVCHHLFNAFDIDSIRHIFANLSGMRIDAVELLGEPSWYPSDTCQVLRDNGLYVSSITAAARRTTGRDLIHPSSKTRQLTREHLLRCVDFARCVDCNNVGVSLTAVGRFCRDEDSEAELKRLESALEWLSVTASREGIIFSIEVLNRFSSPYFNDPSEVLARFSDLPGVMITFDSFHLLTELRNFRDLRACASLTANIQVSGGARGSVSSGIVDPALFVNALVAGGFHGPVTLEAFPVGTAPFTDVIGRDHQIFALVEDYANWFDEWQERGWDQR